MQHLLLQLKELQDSIEQDGILSLHPRTDLDSLELRIEWYCLPAKRGMVRIFSLACLLDTPSSIDLLKDFINQANKYIRNEIQYNKELEVEALY